MEAIVENSPELKRGETGGYKELNTAGVLMLPLLKDVRFKSHTVKNHPFHSQHAKRLNRPEHSQRRKHEGCKASCQKFTLNISALNIFWNKVR